MALLREKGVEFRDDEAVQAWRSVGAEVQGCRIRIDEQLLLQLLSTAPESTGCTREIPKGRSRLAGASRY